MGKKTTTTNTNQNYSGTSMSTPDVPDWLRAPYQTQARTVAGLQGLDPMQFASQASQLQKQAFTGAGALTTSPNYETATGQLNGINYTPQMVSASTMNPASLLDGLDKYYTPFKDQVLNPVLSDYDISAGKTRAAQAGQAASTGAFRGSRYGIREAQTEGELARGRAATEGGLLSDMYKTATGLADSDAARRQAAASQSAQLQTQVSGENASNALTANNQRQTGAGLLATIGGAQGADQRANLATQQSLGATQQQIEDSQRQAPLNYASVVEGLLSGLNPQLFTGQTTDASGQSSGTSTSKTSGSLGSFLGDLLTMGAMGAGGSVGKILGGKLMGAG